MQSSAAVAGRALIMLACVVGIPVLAMSGTSWSEILKKLQDFRLPAILDPAAASTSPPVAQLAQTPPATPIRPNRSIEPAGSGVIPASYQVPADSHGGLSLTATPDSQAGASGMSAGADSFRGIQDRLRELGATYYLLESWGDQELMYRFYCRMAVGGNPNYTHYFEATDSDPLRTMLGVLRQVETWRQGVR
jgi:hypothetical protein